MFLIGGTAVAAGLVVPWYLGQRAGPGGLPLAASRGAGLAPNAWVHVAPDNTVTVWLAKSEMGQGVYTGLAQILGEELDVDPRKLRIEFAPVDAAYNSPFAPLQFTGGSMSINTSYEQLRMAGASARAMLVAAAAKRWGVAAATLRTHDGKVLGPDGSATYGELAIEAARRKPPRNVVLKDPANFRYIGRPLRRLDSDLKITGRARFGIDVICPDMAHAALARSPVFGGRLRSFDDSGARAVPGVLDVKRVSAGVAVLATHTWAALQGRDALRIEWDEGAGAALSTDGLRTQYRALLQQQGVTAQDVGDVDAALGSGARAIDVEYELPFLAHACMEPLNCVAHVTAEGCEVWTGTQFQSPDRDAAAALLGMRPEQVQIHTQFLGGGFGRRANPQSDFVLEAVELAREAGRPVKITWTREDDMRAGWYRPFGLSRIRAAVDADGLPLAWHHTLATQPLLRGTLFAGFIPKDQPDPSIVEGAMHMPYAIANLRVSVHEAHSVVPVQWWRSVGHSHTAFAVNSAIDELAALGGRDPLSVRRVLLADKPRHLAVLNAAAQRAGWGRELEPGHFHGIALQESFGSIVAQVAEVSVMGGAVRVHRMTCAIDCGLAVNPAGVIAQMESAVVFGLTAALHGEIRIEAGRAVQSNFDDYPLLRIGQMPFVDTILVAGDGPMGGAGEPGVPPVAPAVCNAIFAATGKRIRRLPVTSSL
jgi:isoquinoline 1-oxidoreductase beta subunit